MTDEKCENNTGSGEQLEAFRERFTLDMEKVAMFYKLVNYIWDEIDLIEDEGKQRIVAAFGAFIVREVAKEMLQRLSLEKGGGQHSVQIFGWYEDFLKGECDVE